jgi:hypothetical protein
VFGAGIDSREELAFLEAPWRTQDGQTHVTDAAKSFRFRVRTVGDVVALLEHYEPTVPVSLANGVDLVIDIGLSSEAVRFTDARTGPVCGE